MAHNYTNTECKLYGTKYCTLLNMESCDTCTVATASSDQAEKLARSLDATIALMPEGGIAGLFESESCVLCKDGSGKREWYADVDLGNSEPRTETRNVIGLKSIARTGSMVPLQIACCKDCRKRLLLIEYLPTVLTLFISILALVLMSVKPIRESLMMVSEILPVTIFVAVVLAGLLVGGVLRKNLIKNAEPKTYLRVLDLPALAHMKERGWFEINDGKKGVTRYVFAKKRIRQGLYTGDSAKTSKNSEKSI